MAAIRNKIEPDWPHSDRLQLLIREEVSLDQVFDTLAIPVLLTYDSDAVNDHNRVSEDYLERFREEMRHHHTAFTQVNPIGHLHVHLFLLPLEEKAALVETLHQKLTRWQAK